MPFLTDKSKVTTICVLLVRIWHKPAVVRDIRNAIVVVIIITLVPKAILICVQLRAVYDIRAVVFGVLVAISITGTKEKHSG